MRIGIFTETYFPQVNGVAISTAILKKNLEQNGHEVYIFTTTNPLAPQNEDRVYRIPSLPFVSGHRLGKFYDGRLVGEIKSLNLDIVHTHTEFSLGIFGRIIAKKLQIPRIHTYHTIYEDYTHHIIKFNKLDIFSKALARKMSKKVCNSAEMVIVPTQKVKQLLESYGVRKKMLVIPTGIELGVFADPNFDAEKLQEQRAALGIKEHEKVILNIGRISKEKNIEELLTHLQLYLHEKPDIKLVLVGDGPDKRSIESLVKQLDIENHVIFVGEVPWELVVNYYQIGDVFVSASQSETQGITYIEALATGLPVVAKRDSCLEGVVEHDVNGYTFDYKEEFLEALDMILYNKHHQERLAVGASQSVEKFSENIFAENVASSYHDVLAMMKPSEKRIQNYATSIRYKVFMTVLIIVAAITLLLLNASRWVSDSGILSFEQVIFLFRAPRVGASPDVIWGFIWDNIPSVIFMMIFSIFVFIHSLKWKKKSQRTVLMIFLLGVLALSGVTWNHVRFELHVQAFLENQQTYSTFIDDHYVNPRDVDLIFPDEGRNLIHIYLESMETTFMATEEGGVFAESFIPELASLASEYINFSQSEQLGGAFMTVNTTWTTAAMFAQTAGLPLNLPVGEDSILLDALFLTYEEIALFPAEIMTFGEILEAEGYRQVLMMGSDATFGGRRYYFTGNGNYEIWDYHTAIQLGLLPEDYYEWWGFEDEHLFDYAKEKVMELGEGDEPFNFTLLTADTHFEDGFLSEQCDEPFDVQYANVLACSSRMVYEFVRWIQEQPFYENTTIVITGDHLTMQSIDSEFWEAAIGLENYDRTVYHVFINADAEPTTTNNRLFTTMDFFPTILASLGVQIEGDRLGLGTNLFGDEATLLEEVGIDEMNRELQHRSAFFESSIEDVE